MEWSDETILALSESLCEAVVARFPEGRVYGEIAEEMGVSESTICYRVNMGVERIRRPLRAKGVSLTTVGLSGILRSEFVHAATASFYSAHGCSLRTFASVA